MRGNYEGKTADEVREDLRKAIRAVKAARDSVYDFSDKYNAIMNFGSAYSQDTFKEERDERRKERIKLHMYDIRALAKILGKTVYYEKRGADIDAFPYRGYFYFEDAEIDSWYSSAEVKGEDING